MTTSWSTYSDLARVWAAEDRRMAAWFDELLAADKEVRRRLNRRMGRANRHSLQQTRRTRRHGAPRGHWKKRRRNQ